MLFLYRPPQTWMPFYRPRKPMEQDAYNRHLQAEFQATQRVPGYAPGGGVASQRRLAQLTELHTAGVLTDAEFNAARARLALPPGRPPG